mmetsp:Transcript_54082/g.131270  ORF Transcript_54082/g.131270 Transcript_54082/m.131270 type:complete len:230 (-) Transcript_54082:393-1082(-)
MLPPPAAVDMTARRNISFCPFIPSSSACNATICALQDLTSFTNTFFVAFQSPSSSRSFSRSYLSISLNIVIFLDVETFKDSNSFCVDAFSAVKSSLTCSNSCTRLSKNAMTSWSLAICCVTLISSSRLRVSFCSTSRTLPIKNCFTASVPSNLAVKTSFSLRNKFTSLSIFDNLSVIEMMAASSASESFDAMDWATLALSGCVCWGGGFCAAAALDESLAGDDAIDTFG